MKEELVLVSKCNEELQLCPLKIGDNVMLYSGSPVMEVKEVNIKNSEYENGIKCMYNIVGDDIIEYIFERGVLVKLL